MAKKHVLYEKLTGKPLQVEAKKFPINEETFGWADANIRAADEPLNLREHLVVEGVFQQVPELVGTDEYTADDVKSEAYFKIKSVVPLWKQQNYHRQWSQLQQKAELTADETALQTKIEGVWTWIDAMRSRSEILENDLALATSNPDWPNPPSEV